MPCHINPGKPRRPLPAARFPRRSPPAVRGRTTCQLSRRPRDRYPVTNVTDIHLCRTSSSGNEAASRGLAGSGAARGRQSPLPRVRGQPDAGGSAGADLGPPPARLPGLRPDRPENPCLTRPVLLVANALVPVPCDPYSHRRERREAGGGRCAFYRPGGTPRCPTPTRPWESATPSARTSAGTGTATKTPPTLARGCWPWRTVWAGTRAARWPAPRRSRRSARWTPRYPPRT